MRYIHGGVELPHWLRMALVLVLAMWLAAGCGMDESATQTDNQDPLTSELDDCQTIFDGTPTDPSGLVIVADRTASVVDFSMPDALHDQIVEQSLAGGGVTVIGVNGPGEAPAVVLRKAALSNDRPRDAPSVQTIAESMPACVTAVIEQEAIPEVEGTDFYAAASAAAEVLDTGASMWWLTDLSFNAGQLDLRHDGLLHADAAEAAATLSETAQLDLKGARLHVSGIGNSVTPISPHGRVWLTEFSVALCTLWNATGCEDITREPDQSVRSDSAILPDDEPLPFPEITAEPEAGPEPTCTFTVPHQLTFDGDSAELRRDAAETLREPIELMHEHPESYAMVTGHTPSSTRYTKAELVELSENRASSTIQPFLEYGIAEDRFQTRGVGDAEPLNDHTDPATGLQIPELAEMERRVTITIVGMPCP